MRMMTRLRHKFDELQQRLDDLREWAECPEARYGPQGRGWWYTASVAVLAGLLATAHFGGFVFTGDSSEADQDAVSAGQVGVDGGSPQFLVPPKMSIPEVVSPEASEDRVEEPEESVPEPAAEVAGPMLVPASQTGIPATVLLAYREAADRLGIEQPGCGLPVPLLAGIGRVESGHAYGGRVDETGQSLTAIIGIALDGGPDVALIRDTDGGRLDGDTTYDRAVGPMQFIPGTWSRWAADGNADGVRDPQNVFDASLAAGRYLCAAGRNLNTGSGVQQAILAYNPSEHYLQTVLSWMRVYADGATEIPDGQTSTGVDRAKLVSAKVSSGKPGKSAGSADSGKAVSGKGAAPSSSSSTSQLGQSSGDGAGTSSGSGSSSSGSSGSSGGSGGSGQSEPEQSPSQDPNDGSGTQEQDPAKEEEPPSEEEPQEESSPDNSGDSEEQPDDGSDSEEQPDDGSSEEPVLRVNPNPPGS